MSVSHGLKRSATLPVDSSTSNSTEDHVYSNVLEEYDINKNNPIGYGASAIVYGAIYKPLNKTVAVKIIDLDYFERNQIDEVRRETQLMSLSKHPNILRVYGSFVNESKLFIVTPYMSAGSCSDIMKTAYPDGFEEIVIATILKQALQGLEYLHKHGHIHRDVKAGNLLVDEDGTVLLADFGVSSSLTEGGDKKSRKTFVGTPCWMAPEVMEGAEYDYKADIWSFGITSLELATGHAPFAKFPPLKVIMITIQNEPPTLDRDATKHKYAQSFKEMIDKCLQKDPTKRPTTEKLLTHAFFKQAKKKDYLVTKILHSLKPLEERPHKRVQQKPIVFEKGVTWDFTDDGEYREREVSDETLSNSEKRVVFSLSSEGGEQPTLKEEQGRKSRFLVNQGANSETEATALQSPPPMVSQNAFSQPQSPAEINANGLTQQDIVNEEQVQQRLQKKGRFVIGDKNVAQAEVESHNTSFPREQLNENLTDNRKGRFRLGDASTLANQTITKISMKKKLSTEAGIDGNSMAHLFQDSDSIGSHISKLIQHNESQRIILNEILQQQIQNYQKPSTLNGNDTTTRDLNDVVRENEELRKQNEELKRKIEYLEKNLRDLNPSTINANANSETARDPSDVNDAAAPSLDDSNSASNSL
ncbi:7555_t:CDS:10 [Acaulospora morrowiae]|uniref:7555_t:CDS:1 n=1 Tax=Acaulospora morrowiae TaxID=94023 RepID=A0A9N9HTX8_9GLOM|nr:7555_t:CDS:10 [Acaulospora morrowiae]